MTDDIGNGAGYDLEGRPYVTDPTLLTDKAIAKEATARKEAHSALQESIAKDLAIRDERLRGIDEATKLRLGPIDGVPGRIVQEVTHLELLADAKRDAVAKISHIEMGHQREISDIRFAAAEKLTALGDDLRATALTAAFAAQKEASAKEAEYTKIASNKAETATADAIDKLGVLFDTRVGGVEQKVDDVRTRMTGIENRGVGSSEQRTEGRQSNTAVIALASVVVGLLILVVAILALVIPRIP